ncbi:MAG: (2Fe-2S)-binding protein [Leptospiraceae bacterium]|nr:(2Fe-2S)-binding protein [Leptospiraceae bacterium]
MRLSLSFPRNVFVCICKAVNDRAIRESMERGSETLEDLERDLGVGSSCGRCRAHAAAVLADHRQSMPDSVFPGNRNTGKTLAG